MKPTLSPLFLTAVSLMALAGISRGALVTYTIDPARSSLTMAAAYSTFDITAQTAGSLIDSYNGSITGDLVGGTLTFSGGSTIIALLNPVAGAGFAPLPGTGGIDNYGGEIQAIGATLSFRSINFDLLSGDVVSGTPSTAPLEFTSGHADYFAPPLVPPNGTVDFIGETAANTSALNATLLSDGSVETLTIPVTVFYPGDLSATFTGQIVAVRNIPEPTSLMLAAMGLAVGLRRRRA